MTDTPLSSDPTDELPSGFRVEGGSPSAEEAAAIEALLTGMAAEWAETKHRRVLDAPSGWMRDARGLRAPLTR